MIQNLQQLLARLAGYSLVEVVIELLLIALVVYVIVRFLRGTRGAGVIKGLALLLVAGTLAVRVLGQGGEHFQRLNFLYDRALGFMAIALVVLFQPEIRRALMRLGEAGWLKGSRSNAEAVIQAVVESCEYLSKNQFGALIAIERSVGLRGLVEGGVQLNADVSSRLLQSIFWPNSALHDLGVIISDGKVLAANVQFPMYEAEELAGYYELGSRHRAALCLSKDSDCIAVIVSEERGTISIAERGRLRQNLKPDDLRRLLTAGLIGLHGTTRATSGQTGGDSDGGPEGPPQSPGDRTSHPCPDVDGEPGPRISLSSQAAAPQQEAPADHA